MFVSFSPLLVFFFDAPKCCISTNVFTVRTDGKNQLDLQVKCPGSPCFYLRNSGLHECISADESLHCFHSRANVDLWGVSAVKDPRTEFLQCRSNKCAFYLKLKIKDTSVISSALMHCKYDSYSCLVFQYKILKARCVYFCVCACSLRIFHVNVSYRNHRINWYALKCYWSCNVTVIVKLVYFIRKPLRYTYIESKPVQFKALLGFLKLI